MTQSRAEQLDEKLTQYQRVGDKLFPSNETDLKLSAGMYKIGQSMQGIYFEEHPVKTDAILQATDERLDHIIDEADKFWSVKEQYKKVGMMHKRGILLHSAPGTGKSILLARLSESAIANDSIVITGTQPRGLVEGLKSLRAIEPDRDVMILLDDADKFLHDESTLIGLLDGEDSIDNILFVACTNYLERFPKRLRRTGRFDTIVEIKNPPKEVRRAYFKNKMPNATEATIKSLVDETKDLSFSDMKEMVISTSIYGRNISAEAKRIRTTKAVVKTSESIDEAKLKSSDANHVQAILQSTAPLKAILSSRKYGAQEAEFFYKSGTGHLTIDTVYVSGIRIVAQPNTFREASALIKACELATSKLFDNTKTVAVTYSHTNYRNSDVSRSFSHNKADFEKMAREIKGATEGRITTIYLSMTGKLKPTKETGKKLLFTSREELLVILSSIYGTNIVNNDGLLVDLYQGNYSLRAHAKDPGVFRSQSATAVVTVERSFTKNQLVASVRKLARNLIADAKKIGLRDEPLLALKILGKKVPKGTKKLKLTKQALMDALQAVAAKWANGRDGEVQFHGGAKGKRLEVSWEDVQFHGLIDERTAKAKAIDKFTRTVQGILADTPYGENGTTAKNFIKLSGKPRVSNSHYGNWNIAQELLLTTTLVEAGSRSTILSTIIGSTEEAAKKKMVRQGKVIRALPPKPGVKIVGTRYVKITGAEKTRLHKAAKKAARTGKSKKVQKSRAQKLSLKLRKRRGL